MRARPVTPTRPLPVGEIADRGLQAYRRNFLPLYTLAILPSATGQVSHWLLMAALAPPGDADPLAVLAYALAAILIALLLIIPLWLAAAGGTVWAAAEAASLRRVRFGQAFHAGTRALPRLLATILPLWLVLLVGTIVPAVLLGGLALTFLIRTLEVAGFVLGVFLATLALGPFFFLFLRTVLTTPVLVLEGSWFLDAIARSWRLMGYRPPGCPFHGTPAMRATALLLALSAVGISVLCLAVAPEALLVAIQVSRHGGLPPGGSPLNPWDIPLPALVAAQLFSLLAQGLASPLFWIFVTLFYGDLRARSEGTDLRERIASLAGAA